MKTKTLLFDISAVVLVVVLSFVIGFFPFSLKEKGATVKISSPGFSGEYLLSENTEINLSFAKITVKDGFVFVSESNCPDKLCERFGKISKSGESIICVPNKLTVKITGSGEVDSVAE